ncbi:transmembrane protein, putative [Bodo saltans]|uniref:Transmembrane protein, putative n=1 Tax=Bodo saltans TaxID=75058 RepID=A0A0S4J602_BODSA|nr:transmembrane protein, putative [Bodo saltans]|eukprot:CUG80307.1 transmembrane protein, putative [Bodo saltans]
MRIHMMKQFHLSRCPLGIAAAGGTPHVRYHRTRVTTILCLCVQNAELRLNIAAKGSFVQFPASATHKARQVVSAPTSVHYCNVIQNAAKQMIFVQNKKRIEIFNAASLCCGLCLPSLSGKKHTRLYTSSSFFRSSALLHYFWDTLIACRLFFVFFWLNNTPAGEQQFK